MGYREPTERSYLDEISKEEILLEKIREFAREFERRVAAMKVRVWPENPADPATEPVVDTDAS